MLIPPFKIKVVEPIKLLPRTERIRVIERAGLNPFLIKSEEIYIDLLTDSGTAAMSDNQWAGMMLGDESYAGSKNFYSLQRTVEDILGFPYCLPTHQGRGAEKVFNTLMVKKGQYVLGNMHFDTTRAHIEDREGVAVDLPVKEVFDTQKEYPFKGNIDISKLRKFLQKNAKKVAYVLFTITNNTVGGQPVSLENIKACRNITKDYKIPLFFDLARFAENAYFIKVREQPKKSIREIIKLMMAQVDGGLMSAKKDALVNIGGFIALRDQDLYKKLCPINVLYEGFPTYGGLAGRDMEAIARGLYEGIDENYLAYRIGQVQSLGQKLSAAGIPIVRPIGGHAVYIDGKRFLPNIWQEQFPSHALCVTLYIEGGIRVVEIGALLAGRDPKTGKNRLPKLDLVRLTIPRRVYTGEHIDYVAEVVKKVWQKREKIRGLKFIYEAPILRHFQSKFAWV